MAIETHPVLLHIDSIKTRNSYDFTKMEGHTPCTNKIPPKNRIPVTYIYFFILFSFLMLERRCVGIGSHPVYLHIKSIENSNLNLNFKWREANLFVVYTRFITKSNRRHKIFHCMLKNHSILESQNGAIGTHIVFFTN